MIVQPGGKKPDNSTAALSAKEKDVIYMIQNEEENEPSAGAAADTEEELMADDAQKRRKQLRSEDPNFNAKEAKRKERQVEILKDKNAETLRRLTEAKNKNDNFDPTKGGRRVCLVCQCRRTKKRQCDFSLSIVYTPPFTACLCTMNPQ